MTTPYRVSCPSFPIVRQHDPDPDGQPSPGRDLDCGEACIVAILRYIHGVTALSVEDVRRDLLRDATADTMPEQIARYLREQCNVPNTIIQPPANQADYLWWEYHYLFEAQPLIALRSWETLGSPYLHYCCVTEQTESTSVVMDPENGSFVTEPYALHWQMAQGHSTLIGIDRAADVT